MVLIGESFDGYVPKPDAGPDTMMPMPDAGAFTSAPHPIDDCTPAFTVANDVGYPDKSPGDFDLSPTADGGIFTDDNPQCYQPPNRPPLPYCLILGGTIRVQANATLGTLGKRPLVLMAVHDVSIDGNVNVGGTDSFGGGGGPGAHPGSAVAYGGGGAGMEPGAGACKAEGGVPVLEAGLFGGGNGGGFFDPSVACHAGGYGGGALQIVSLCGKISIRGSIDASGGGGGSIDDPVCGVGFGGGGGGTVWIQGQQFAFDTANGATINLSGGGGGGGTCREMGSGSWTTGQSGNREAPGVGASCVTGGAADGGRGGGFNDSPEAGVLGVAQQPGEIGCSGAGGGRGLLMFQLPMMMTSPCTDLIGFQTGICKTLPLQ
jgi:hypothetical protein